MKRVRSIILDIAIYAVIIGGVIFGLPRFLSWSLGTSYPMAAVTSGSMWPALKEGDLVLVEGIGKDDLKVGDIAIYRNESGNGFTIHRVVALGEKTFTTKGDANFSDDEPTSYKNLIGKNYTIAGYAARIPYLGFITVAASRRVQ